MKVGVGSNVSTQVARPSKKIKKEEERIKYMKNKPRKPKLTFEASKKT